MPDYLNWLRSRVGSRKVILAFATALILDDDGRLLFQKRTDFREAWWGLPGGVLEIGESFEQCAVREAFEETGLHVEPTRLVGVYTSPDFDVRYPNGDEVQQFTVAIECRVTGGDSRPDGVEVAEHHFFSMDDWSKLTLPPWYAAMARDFASGKPPQFDPPVFNHNPGDDWRALRALTGPGRILAAGGTIADVATSAPPKPANASPGMVMFAPGGELFDFGRQLSFYMSCGSNRSKNCDPARQKLTDAALSASGADREKLMTQAYDEFAKNLLHLPFMDVVAIWGVNKDLDYIDMPGGRRIQINTTHWLK